MFDHDTEVAVSLSTTLDHVSHGQAKILDFIMKGNQLKINLT